MAVITTNSFTQRLSKRLQKHGQNLWVGQSSGDKWGKYLLFIVGGRAVASCGWTRAEAESIVAERIAK
jgi:hypothetical protein